MDWDLMKRGMWYRVIHPSVNYFFVPDDMFRIIDSDTVDFMDGYTSGTKPLETCKQNSEGMMAVPI